MKSNTIRVLFVVTIVALAAAFFVQQSRQSASERGASETLMPGLKENVNSVRQVRITGAGGDLTTTLENSGDQWGIAEKGGYRADIGKIRELLLKLGDARIVEYKTARPENYARLGVEDVTTDGASGVQIDLQGLETAALIVGDGGARGGNATYVRRLDEPRALLVNAALDVDASPVDWLDKDILDVPSAEIQSVVVSHADGETVTVQKFARDATDFVVADIPEGRELSSATIANSMGQVLQALRMEDVVPAADWDGDPQTAVRTRYVTFNGLVIDALSWEKDNTFYASFQAGFDAGQSSRFMDAPATDEATGAGDEDEATGSGDTPLPGDAGQAQDLGDRATRDRADSINTRVQPWVFRLPRFKHEQMTRRMDNLLASETTDE